jgi:hypothetical protein
MPMLVFAGACKSSRFTSREKLLSGFKLDHRLPGTFRSNHDHCDDGV